MWTVNHIDLKTGFLHGEAYDHMRNVVCALPPEAGYPRHIGARLLKPAYGMKDTPRRWWDNLDTKSKATSSRFKKDQKAAGSSRNVGYSQPELIDAVMLHTPRVRKPP